MKQGRQNEKKLRAARAEKNSIVTKEALIIKVLTRCIWGFAVMDT